MTITIPNQEATVGIASQWSDTIDPGLGALFLSSHPSALPMDYLVAANQNLAAFTVVGFNANKELIPAVLGTTPAIGVLAVAITTPASGPLKGAPTYRSGHFNHKRLVWDATYNTEAKKIMAFEGAPTPTQIRIGAPETYTP